MNYRHIYHAGNICDVVKHASVALILKALRQKDTPFAVLDTHAGVGRYDLEDPRAQKTQEAEAGIRRLCAAFEAQDNLPPFLADYLGVVRDLNVGREIRFYPGSPLLIRAMMRPQDHLTACELHPEDVQDLRALFSKDKQAHIHNRDGYEALGALLPPQAGRGLILIDPPFEKTDEFAQLQKAVVKIHQKWAQGIIAIWYPIKDRAAIWRFHEALIATGIPKIMIAEFLYEPEIRGDKLNGSGLILVNPPWKIDESLADLYAALRTNLSSKADYTIRFCA